MASNMASCFGDVFKGALIHSGLEFGAATSMGEAFTVMRSGPSRKVEQSADLAYRCMKSHSSMVPVIVAHGSSDTIVYPVNFARVVKQFELLNQSIARELGGQGQITSVQKSRVTGPRLTADVVDASIDGHLVIKSVYVDRMSHAWSGGDPSVQYSEPNGPNVTQIFADLFFPAQ
jgi:poly(3-hydroxybutyrate) depolymerase